jgi:hypothetical protein
MTQFATLPAEAPAEAPALASRTLLNGAAFVLLCLWTRSSPDELRDQLSAEAGTCAALGF